MAQEKKCGKDYDPAEEDKRKDLLSAAENLRDKFM